jgi:hypothetical protein
VKESALARKERLSQAKDLAKALYDHHTDRVIASLKVYLENVSRQCGAGTKLIEVEKELRMAEAAVAKRRRYPGRVR